MKPNIIEINEKGIFCYENNLLEISIEGFKEPALKMHNENLEAVKRDRVYFKPEHKEEVWKVMYRAGLFKNLTISEQQGKAYPIPDGYEVKIGKDNCGCNLPDATNDMCKYPECLYAILVPKDNTEKLVDAIVLHGKQQSIEEGAKIYIGVKPDLTIDEEERYYLSGVKEYDAFIAGAKSDAAKKYWYEQFKQQNLWQAHLRKQ